MSPLPHSLCSIVIPTHGRPDYLRDSVNSVLDQTHTNWECLVVSDDPKEFPSKKKMMEAFKDPRVRFVEGKGPGANTSRNVGIEQSRGDFIFFLDDDDFWLTDKIASHLDAHEKSDFVYSPVIRRFTASSIVDIYKNETHESENPLSDMASFRWCPNSISLHRDLAQKESWDESMWTYQDWDYIYRLQHHRPSISYVNNPQTVVREHGLIRSSKSLDKRLAALDTLKNKYPKDISEWDLQTQKRLEVYLYIRDMARFHGRVAACSTAITLHKSCNTATPRINALKILKAIAAPRPHSPFQLFLQKILFHKEMTFRSVNACEFTES